MTSRIENLPKDRWWDVWIAVTALAAILLVATRLWVTEWVENLDILVYLTFLAGLTGIALGYSRFSPWVCALISTVYGIFLSGWLFGTTVEIEMSWHDRILYHLGWRLRVAIEQFITAEPFNDHILFLSIMAILLWILGTSAAFLLIREGSFWPSVLPLGIALLVISHYDQDLARNTRYLMSFLLLMLLILGRLNFLLNKQKWYQEGVHTSAQIQSDLTKALTVMATALIVITLIIPINPQQKSYYSKFWEGITKRWNELTDQVSDIFTFESSARNTPKTGYFSESMRLGMGLPDSEEIVFTVRVISQGYPNYRNYWRARSYDFYNNVGWASNLDQQEQYLLPDSFDINYPKWQGGRPVSYVFTTYVDTMVNLYATGLPTWVNHPVQAITSPVSESEDDLIALIAEPEFEAGDSYQVNSIITMATVNDLRNSSTDYPEWLNPYLQLPEDFSDEVQALAVQIAEKKDNPFSIASDITRYLRINIEYAQTIPPVPAGKDPMAWFLFEEKRGFCNYYATAHVLMLRSVGIPARLAVGFAEGEFDTETDTYTVREKHSHAWSEVYFVRYGWVVFEPTVSQPAIFLPGVIQPVEETIDYPRLEDLPLLEPTPAPSESLIGESFEGIPGDSESIFEEPEISKRSIPTKWLLIGFGVFLLLISIITLLNKTLLKGKFDPLPVAVERRLIKQGKSIPRSLHRWSRMTQMEPPEKAYDQLGQSIRILGQPLNLAETPTERAHTMIELLPNAKIAILDVVNEYQLHQYSNHYSSNVIAKKAARQVRRMAFETRLKKILSFFDRE